MTHHTTHARYGANVALVIIDVQYDFCPDGSLAVPEGDAVIPVINAMRDDFQTVILTQDFHPEGHISFASTHDATPFSTIDAPYGEQQLWPDHCVQNSLGVQFHDALIRRDSDLILQKGTHKDIDSYSCFFENDGVTAPRFDNGKTLAETLAEMNIDTVVVTGLAGDYCVAWSAVDARKHHLHTLFIEDATRSITAPSYDKAVSNMWHAGVHVTTSDRLDQHLDTRTQKLAL